MFLYQLYKFKFFKETLFLILFGIFILYTPPVDPDFGWHFRYGEYLFKNHQVLTKNIFAYTMPNYEWTNFYSLSEFIMYLPIHFFGEIYGPMILSLAFSLFLSVFLYKLFSKVFPTKFAVYVGMFLLPLILNKNVVTVRPLFFSTVFLLTLIYVLLCKKESIKFLPLLFLVWANMHADWMFGLFAFGLYYGEQILRNRKILLNKVLLFLGLSFASVLINPHGFKLYETMFLKEAHPIQFNNISEWLPVVSNFSALKDISSFFVFYVIALALIGVATFELRKKQPLWLTGSIIFFSLLSVRSQYFLRIALLFGILPIATYFGDLVLEFKKVFGERQLKKIQKALKISFVLLFMFLLSFFGRNLYLSTSVARWSKEFKYPYESVQIIKRDNLKGKVFNTYGWGGYLIWQLPEKKVFIAGHMPTWRTKHDDVFREYLDITKEEGGYLLLNSSEYDDIKIIIFQKDTEFASKVESLAGWDKYFENEFEVLFVKK